MKNKNYNIEKLIEEHTELVDANYLEGEDPDMIWKCCNTCRHFMDDKMRSESDLCGTCHSELLDGTTGIRTKPSNLELKLNLKENVKWNEHPEEVYPKNKLFKSSVTFTEEYTTAISENKEHIIEELIESTVNDLNEVMVRHTISFDRKQACDAIRNAIPMKPIETSSGYICSMCQNEVYARYKYCCECGQKLDWKDIL